MAIPTPVSLKAYIDADATTGKQRGYATMTPGELEVGINQDRTGQTIDVHIVDAATVQAAVVGSEYDALTTNKLLMWQGVLQAGIGGGIPVDSSNIRTQIQAIWGPGTTTRNNMAALQTKDNASDAEDEWGDGVVVNGALINEALAL